MGSFEPLWDPQQYLPTRLFFSFQQRINDLEFIFLSHLLPRGLGRGVGRLKSRPWCSIWWIILVYMTPSYRCSPWTVALAKSLSIIWWFRPIYQWLFWISKLKFLCNWRGSTSIFLTIKYIRKLLYKHSDKDIDDILIWDVEPPLYSLFIGYFSWS